MGSDGASAVGCSTLTACVFSSHAWKSSQAKQSKAQCCDSVPVCVKSSQRESNIKIVLHKIMKKGSRKLRTKVLRKVLGLASEIINRYISALTVTLRFALHCLHVQLDF